MAGYYYRLGFQYQTKTWMMIYVYKLKLYYGSGTVDQLQNRMQVQDMHDCNY